MGRLAYKMFLSSSKKGCNARHGVTKLIDTLAGVKSGVAFLLAWREAHSAPTFDQEIPIKDFSEHMMKASNYFSRLTKGKITRGEKMKQVQFQSRILS